MHSFVCVFLIFVQIVGFEMILSKLWVFEVKLFCIEMIKGLGYWTVASEWGGWHWNDRILEKKRRMERERQSCAAVKRQQKIL